MVNTFYIADLHFGHKNIIQYEAETRGKSLTIEDHNELLVERWNSVVKKKSDRVLVLGDFSMGRAALVYAERLNGQIISFGGNHDQSRASTYLQYFHDVKGCQFRMIGEFKCLLQHIPCHPSQLEYRVDFCIHGHLHSKVINHVGTNQPDLRYVCVSAEQQNLTPMCEGQLIEELRNRALALGIDKTKEPACTQIIL